MPIDLQVTLTESARKFISGFRSQIGNDCYLGMTLAKGPAVHSAEWTIGSWDRLKVEEKLAELKAAGIESFYLLDGVLFLLDPAWPDEFRGKTMDIINGRIKLE